MKFSVVSLLGQTLNLVLGNSSQFQAIDLHGSRGRGLFHDIAQFVIEQDGRFFRLSPSLTSPDLEKISLTSWYVILVETEIIRLNFYVQTMFQIQRFSICFPQISGLFLIPMTSATMSRLFCLSQEKILSVRSICWIYSLYIDLGVWPRKRHSFRENYYLPSISSFRAQSKSSSVKVISGSLTTTKLTCSITRGNRTFSSSFIR